MKILVTGANGFVGKSLCATLLSQGKAVRAAMRVADARAYDFEQVVVGSIYGATDWSDALRDVGIVIHLAARVHVMNDPAIDLLAEFRKVNVAGTLNLAKQAAKAGVKRFIFISSVKVNGEQTVKNKPFLETNNANPQDAYSISKYEAEVGLKRIAEEAGMEVVIIRPPLVYGAGVKANFATMMRTVKQGIPLPFGAIHNKRSFVYVGNLVSLIACCIDHPAAKNQVFLVSDGHDLSTTELLQECAVALGVRSRLLRIPQGVIKGCAALLGKQLIAQKLCGRLQVDISKAYALLGWRPPVTVADGLKITALALESE